MKVSVSVLKNMDKLKETVEKLNNTTCNSIHIDVMDGIFVENKTPTYTEIKKGFEGNLKPTEVHLMTINPEKYVERYSKLNPEYIIVHYEVLKNYKIFHEIKKNGIKVGISINPETDVKKIYKLLPKIDLILIMSVTPGAGGQKFMDESLKKINILKNKIDEEKDDILIAVDGGINNKTALLCKKAGADIVMSGSYVTNSDNYQEKIDTIQNL